MNTGYTNKGETLLLLHKESFSTCHVLDIEKDEKQRPYSQEWLEGKGMHANSYNSKQRVEL